MAKAELLNTLRNRLNVSADDLTRKQAVESRLSQHLPNTIPKRCLQSHEALVDLFQSKIESANATVKRIDSVENIVDAISDYLGPGQHDICVTIAHDLRGPALLETGLQETGFKKPAFQELDFSKNSELTIKPWSPKMSLSVCVSDCLGAVAETGSLVVSSSNTMPLSFNFLGEAHIVLLRAELIVGAYEDI